mgnify:CR=1 FL=1|jgi:hypothetical protein
MKRLLAYLFLVLVFVNSNFSYVVAQEIKEKIPEWFINMPKSTEDIIYERGTALSNDLQLSAQQALMHALNSLCRKINTRIAIKNNTTTIKSECEIPKYEIEELRMVQTDNGNIRTFLVLKYKLDSE